MKIRNQKGVGHLGIILAIVVVAAAAAVGWYVYDHNKKDDAKPVSAVSTDPGLTPEPVPTEEQQSASKSYMTIKQWGVRIPTEGLDSPSYGLPEKGVAEIYSHFAGKTGQVCVTTVAVLRGKGSDGLRGGAQGQTIKWWYDQSKGYYAADDGYYYVPPAESSGVNAACGKTEAVAISNMAVLDQQSDKKLWNSAADASESVGKALGQMAAAE